MSAIIKVEGLGKSYTISHNERERYVALRDVIAKKTKKIFSFNGLKEGKDNASSKEEFWALKDINFEVQQGDRLGIIGRNGAGKSTLLKVLSRITEPTTGKVKIKGRVASLLEVGTGFHPELTGRENIYLNGAILGMSRAEVRKKFDEIVDFSGVEKFLDTPVKRFSSGMYVRLAFAVAAHLEPEILLIDEVLAVGDAEFQRKCLGKMEEVSKNEGRTILFVSHNMNAIEKLCNTCILLNKGKIYNSAVKPKEVIAEYLSVNKEIGKYNWSRKDSAVDNQYFRLEKFYLSKSLYNYNEEIKIFVEGSVIENDPALQLGISVYDESGALLFWSYHTDSSEADWIKLYDGNIKISVTFPCRWLNEGDYYIEFNSALFHRTWLIGPGSNRAPKIKLRIKNGFNSSIYWMEKRPGTLAPLLTWEKIDG